MALRTLHRGLSLVVLAWAAAGPALAADPLTLERVVLSTGGVGYFEYQVVVEGDATLTLDFDRDQVDDVLKSIVVFDSAGHVGAASLPGEEPLAQYFRNLPFGPEALGSPVALLQSLQGASLRVKGQRAIEGRLLQVVPEQVVLPDGGGTLIRHRLSIMTANGIAQAVLEDAEEVTFLDLALQAQIEGALAAVADNRLRDRRSLTLLIEGEGTRTVTVGYVVAAPLWKASYRATLPGAAEKTGNLLGWAHLENLSGQDWKGVDLTLVSGNPVTFRQAIYRAYLVDRPEVPVEVLGRILPRLDQGAVELRRAAGLGGAASLDEMDAEQMAKSMADSVARESSMMDAAPAPIANPPALFDMAMAQAGTEAATQVLFHVPDPVTLERGRSLMVPIIAQAVPMERVAVYQPATHPRHPVASVRLVNAGAAGLAPGVMTLYEMGAGGAEFVGDARFATLPAGDERLVGYALDQKTLIDVEPAYGQSIGKAKIHDGVLELEFVDRQTTTYRIKTLPGEARSIVIEQPRQLGWTLVEPKGLEAGATATDYRVPVSVAADSDVALDVVLELTQWQQMSLADLGVDSLIAYAETGTIDATVRKALQDLVGLRREIAVARGRIEALDLDRQRLFEDQARIRNNLYEVPQGSDLEAQYLEKLTVQEGELAANEAERDKAMGALTKAERELADRIANLDI
ncbi:MAG: DUF4139 domain-containing protein [Alphaproteobacteria bacterium]|nr:DUF4139 domain-containing protein [Alphaproteobacteria bacterium]